MHVVDTVMLYATFVFIFYSNSEVYASIISENIEEILFCSAEEFHTNHNIGVVISTSRAQTCNERRIHPKLSTSS